MATNGGELVEVTRRRLEGGGGDADIARYPVVTLDG
jgi:hypothetical protein